MTCYCSMAGTSACCNCSNNSGLYWYGPPWYYRQPYFNDPLIKPQTDEEQKEQFKKLVERLEKLENKE